MDKVHKKLLKDNMKLLAFFLSEECDLLKGVSVFKKK